MTASAPLVIGVGNTDRGDDGIGPAAVRALHRLDPSLDVLVREGDLGDLALCWEGRDDVVIVDACHSQRPPGSLILLARERLGERVPVSTHGLDVAAAIRLADHLGRLPQQLTIVGVAARSFAPGPLSAELAAAVPTIAAHLRELARGRCIDAEDASSSRT